MAVGSETPGINERATFQYGALEGTVTPVPRSVRRLPDDPPMDQALHEYDNLAKLASPVFNTVETRLKMITFCTQG
ncbi:MAG: hypothetical protein WCP12_15160 [bacterium]